MGDPRFDPAPPTHPGRRAVLTGAVAAAAAPLIPRQATAAPATPRRAAGPGRPLAPQDPDPDLVALLRAVDPGRIEATVRRLVAFGTRHTMSSQDHPTRGIGAARDWLYAELQAIAATAGGRMAVEKQRFVQPAGPRLPVDTPITNVVATLRGSTSPERTYVVTGHYDSRVTDVLDFTSDAPGADDDASGVAAVLELARLFATREVGATLVFALVAGEEQGLFGSAHLAKSLKAANVDVQGMFSNDIVGASEAFDGTPPDPHSVRLFVEGVPTAETPQQTTTRQSTGGENDGPSRQLGRFVRDVAENPATDMRVRVVWRRDRYLRGSDHISFLQQGYPAARFTEPRENFDHEHQDVRVENGVQYGDLPEFCDFAYIARVARVNGAALWSLARAPGTPRDAVIVTSRLTNDTTLRWRRGPEPDLAGYEVVWRDTTEPEWTHVIPVGDTTTATVDLSKDNVLFGVRAVSRAGHRSPVAAPQPGA
ncbi:aminopeptidase [Pilimelia anulata]|uniref:Aminopeptidase n=1 Tax=Pilimelia anulata TaxID=53371 RepID=A0A8J3B8D8_9ACTN|nr:M28 family peptidase [Pilimelia anulata]GGK03009.1 aminopeptidase [Pilimelia anulata]